MPGFEHGDFGLYETQAILRYLDDIFPEPRLQPRDPREAARMNQIIGIKNWYFFPKAAAVIVFLVPQWGLIRNPQQLHWNSPNETAA